MINKSKPTATAFVMLSVLCQGCDGGKNPTQNWTQFVDMFGSLYNECPLDRASVSDLQIQDIGFETSVYYSRIKYDVGRRAEIIKALTDGAGVPSHSSGSIKSDLRTNIGMMTDQPPTEHGLPAFFTPSNLGSDLQILTIQWLDQHGNLVKAIRFYFSDKSDEAYFDTV